MATLKIQLPGNGTKVYRIHKKLTSLGRGEEADVALPDPSLSDSPAHIHFDGREFNLAATDRDAEIFVNGRKRTEAEAGARGSDPDRLGRAGVLALRPAGRRRDRGRRRRDGAGLLQEALRVQRQADGELRAADAGRPAARRDDPGVERRQGVPGADGVGRAGRQGRRATCGGRPSPTLSASSPIRSWPTSSRPGSRSSSRTPSTTRRSRTRCRW